MIFPRKDKNKNRKIPEEKKMRVLKVNKENTKNILSDLLKRSPNNYDQYAGTVQGILDEIKEKIVTTLKQTSEENLENVLHLAAVAMLQ